MSVNDNQSEISKKDLLIIQAEEAGSFYKQTLTISTAFLGGSLIFIEKISPCPSNVSLVFYALGSLFLVGAIGMFVFIRYYNLLSLKHVMENKIEEAIKIDSKNTNRTRIASILISVGILFIVIFGIINLYNKNEKKMEGKMGKDEKISSGNKIMLEMITSSSSKAERMFTPSSAVNNVLKSPSSIDQFMFTPSSVVCKEPPLQSSTTTSTPVSKESSTTGTNSVNNQNNNQNNSSNK